MDSTQLIVDFVNTLDVSVGADALGTAEGYATWLRHAGLAPGSNDATERERAVAVELRERLRACLLAHHDRREDPGALRALEAVIADQPLRLRFGDDGSAFLAGDGTPGGPLIAAVADAVMRAQLQDRWQRLRICPSSDCLEAFYDETRSGTRRWCSMDVCGNRNKVGAYRRRQRRSDTA